MLQWPVLEMTMMLNLIHSRTKGLEYPTHEEYSHGATLCIPWIPKSPNHQITKPPNHQTTKSPNHQITKPPNHQTTKSPNHQITKFQVFVFRYSGSVVRYGHSCLGIQAQYSGLCLGTHIQYSYSGSHIQVFRFRYSGLEFRFGYTGLFRFMYSHSGIQVWVYRLADKYKALTFSIHIQGIQVYNSGLGVQTCLYTQACIPKPECLNVNTECEYPNTNLNTEPEFPNMSAHT